MRILVLGGDGYLGWPRPSTCPPAATRWRWRTTMSGARTTWNSASTAWSRSSRSTERIRVWRELSGTQIVLFHGDLTDAAFAHDIVEEFRPDAIVHFAEQRSAPYSMIDRAPRCLHPVQQRGRHPQRALRHRRHRPRHPPGQARHHGRVRHAQHRHRGGLARGRRTRAGPTPCCSPSGQARSTTCPRCTTATTSSSPAGSGDCGPPTSTRASSTARRPTRPRSIPGLATRFDYDDVFGTVLNRMVVQAVLGHPLTVYGSWRPDPGPDQHRRHGRMHPHQLRDAGRGGRVPGVQPVHRADVGAGDRRDGRRRLPRALPGRAPSTTRGWRRSTTTTGRPTPACSTSGLVPHLLSHTLISSLFGIIDRNRTRVNLAALLPDVRWDQSSARVRVSR